MIRRKILTKRIFIFLIFLIGIYCFVVLSNVNNKSLTNFYYETQFDDNESLKCSIPRLDVFAPEIMQHIKKLSPLKCEDNLLDLIITENGYAKLRPEILEKHKDAHCSLVYIKRYTDDITKLSSNKIELNFANPSVKLENDFFEADCRIPSESESSIRIYAAVSRDEKLIEKIKKKANKNEFNLNILFYGFDSLSRVHFQRKLPKTYDLLTKKLNATILQSYNIVGDGSPQALIPILTGKTEIELPNTLKSKRGSSYVDVYPFIWGNFTANGYITQYSEDTPYIGTFTYRMRGFNKQPTNLYLRPYYLRAWKKHFKNSNYCYGNKPRHQIMLNWTTEFFSTYNDIPKYSFNFYTEISHDDFNLVQIADQDIVDWFNKLEELNVFNNSIGILMSDHGARFSSMRSTLQGKYEERLPFFSFILPEWFSKRFPNAYYNLKQNAATRLLTPFDIYSTLMTVLTHFNKGKDVDKIKTFKDNNKLPRSLSIFEYIPLNRLCKDADIDNHWCTCLQWTNLKETDKLVIEASDYLVKFINNLNSNFTKDDCSQLTVKEITRAQKIEPEKDLLHFKKSADANGFVPDLTDKTKIENELYQIQLVTSPSDGMYEATMHYNVVKKEFNLKESEISRINKYGDQDWCIHDKLPYLRKYCHCKIPKN